MSQNNEPLTDREEIATALQSVTEDDELTVEDIYGNRINEPVLAVENGKIDIGAYGSPRHRVLDIESARVCEVTDDPMDPVTTGNDITKLWVWD